MIGIVSIKIVADIPDYLGRPAMSATFKVYHRSDHFVVMLLKTSSLSIFKILFNMLQFAIVE